MKISDIKVNPQNPRTIKDDNFKKLVKSIKDFPEMLDARPLVLNKDNVILGGNMRYKAAVEAGLTELPVKIVDWPEDKQREFIIKDNVSGGEWDWDILANEWDTDLLDDWGLELPDSIKEETEVEEDEAPEVDESEPPKSKLGEVYQLGRHRLMCADSTVKENVELLMNGEKADMVVTDPPYGIDLDTDNTKISSGWTGVVKSGANNKKYNKVINDDKPYDVAHIFRDFDYVKEVFLWGANYYADTIPNISKSSWLVWDKTNKGQIYTIGSEFELLYSLQKHRQTIISTRWAGAMGTETQDIKQRVHPTQKPMECITPILSEYSKQGAIVVDLFLGSGSTLIACEQTDRTCYGMELDPKYVDVIRKRYAKFIDPNGWEESWQTMTPAIN